MASTTEKKIKNQEYQSAGRAAFAIVRSKLSPKEKRRLQELVPRYYPTASDQPDGDPPETSTFAGAEVTKAIKQTIKSSETDALHHDLMRLSIQVLNVAIKYRLTREEAFNKLKETLHAGMG